MTTTTYQVKGMTCGRCVQAVSTEVARLDGVRDVAIDLATGELTVISTAAIERDAIRAAVDEAGYELVQ